MSVIQDLCGRETEYHKAEGKFRQVFLLRQVNVVLWEIQA